MWTLSGEKRYICMSKQARRKQLQIGGTLQIGGGGGTHNFFKMTDLFFFFWGGGGGHICANYCPPPPYSYGPAKCGRNVAIWFCAIYSFFLFLNLIKTAAKFMRTESVKCPDVRYSPSREPGTCILCHSIYLQVIKVHWFKLFDKQGLLCSLALDYRWITTLFCSSFPVNIVLKNWNR